MLFSQRQKYLLQPALASQLFYPLSVHFPSAPHGSYDEDLSVYIIPNSPQPGDAQKQVCFAELSTSLLSCLHNLLCLPSFIWWGPESLYMSKIRWCKSIYESVMHAVTSCFSLIAPFVLRACPSRVFDSREILQLISVLMKLVLLIKIFRNCQRKRQLYKWAFLFN